MPENRFTKKFDDADKKFNNEFKDALAKLKGFTAAEVEAMVPGTAGKEAYEALTKVVEEATRKNLSQAKLAADIKQLGDIAVKIARKVPKLAAILV